MRQFYTLWNLAFGWSVLGAWIATSSTGLAVTPSLEWVRQIGTSAQENASGAAVDSQGNPVVVYSRQVSIGAPGVDFFATKYNPQGVSQWTRQVGTTENDTARGVAADSAGSVFITGTTQGSLGGPFQGGVDGFLTKIAGDGTVTWSRQIGGSGVDFAFGVCTDHSGNAMIVGDTDGVVTGSNLGGQDAWIAKYSASGNQIWVRQFGTNQAESAVAAASDSSGNTYVTGSTLGALGGSNVGVDDIFLVKFDSDGNRIWSRQLGSAAVDAGKSVAVDSSGNVYVAGETYGALPGNASSGDVDMFATKYDSAGNRLWIKQWGTASGEECGGIAIDSAGGILVAGDSEGNLGPTQVGARDAFVTRLSSTGDLLGTQQFGTTDRDYANGIATDSAGNVYIGGTTEGSFGAPNAGGMDVYLAKLNAVPEPSSIVLAATAVLIVATVGKCQQIGRSMQPKSCLEKPAD
jgi:hypothetical protein